MKNLFLWIAIVLLPQTLLAGEELKSEALKALVCKKIVSEYEPKEASEYEDEEFLHKSSIQISDVDCGFLKQTVSGKANKKVGSKNYLVGMDIEAASDEFLCKLSLQRSVSLKLDEKDQPVVTLSKWSVSPSINDRICELQVDPRLAKLDFDKDLAKLKKVSNNAVVVPDYLAIGEPDDGTRDYSWTIYVYKEGKEVVGYIAEVWYTNSEGEWTNRYILKYTAAKNLIDTTVEPQSFDYCDNPFLDDCKE